MKTDTDKNLHLLWEGCLQNDRKQQEKLYRQLAPKMLAVCLRYEKDRDEAQDMMQEGFIKMFTNMRSYRGEGSLEGWIRRIMVHCAISRYRKAKKLVLVDDFTTQNIPVCSSYNTNGLDTQDILKLVQQLPKNYRSVFNMYAIEGYSHQEISNNLGMSELLSRTTLHRARALLKNMLNNLALQERVCLV